MEKSKENTNGSLNRGRRADRSGRQTPGAGGGKRIRSFLYRSRPIFNLVLLFLFSAAWIREVLYWFHTDAFGTSLDYWAYTDWLIDYSQGFIRRGLSGEIWRLVPAAIPRLEFVAVLSWVLILAAAFGTVRLLARSWKSLHPLTLFGLLCLPCLFFFYVHDHDATARKEILGTLTVLVHLFIIEKTFPTGGGSRFPEGNLRRYLVWMIPTAVILLPAIILVHEGNFLLFVPLHVMISLTILRKENQRRWVQAVKWTGLLYLPAVISFGAVTLSGTPGYATLLGICNKWAAAGALQAGGCVLPPDPLSGSTLPGSFNPMGWSLAQAAHYTQEIIFMHWTTWILILPVLGICQWYLVRQSLYAILRSRSLQSFSPQSARRYASVFFGKYFLIPLLFSLPVYFTAYDYGRWFTVTCINFVMLAASVNLPCREFALRKKETDGESTAADSPEHLDNRMVFYGVSMLICILAVVLWLPHYCIFSCTILRSPQLLFSHNYIVH